MNPIVIGLDMSLTGTGIAGIAEDGKGWSCSVGSSGKADATWPERFERIENGVKEILSVLFQVSPGGIDLAVVEGPSLGKMTGHLWDRAGLWHHLLWELRMRGIPVAIVPPANRAKWATGKGNAGKGDVIEAMARRYGDVWETFHGSDDEADAAAMVTAGLWALGYPVAKVPQVNADGLKAVVWPLVSQNQAEAK